MEGSAQIKIVREREMSEEREQCRSGKGRLCVKRDDNFDAPCLVGHKLHII